MIRMRHPQIQLSVDTANGLIVRDYFQRILDTGMSIQMLLAHGFAMFTGH
jgi:hypothetical protein